MSQIKIEKQSFFRVWLPLLLTGVTALSLLFYTILRAKHLSMTHDESGSFTIWTEYPIFQCFFSPDCWGTANLHWLFILLMKPSVQLFGESELAVRLPSLMGHAIYLWFSFRLVKIWSPNKWIALTGFLLINLNPFLLDFFSLARGYGLAMTFLMVSIFYLGQFAQSGKPLHASGAIGGAILAVFSNFTMLIFFACLLLVLAGIAIIKHQNKQGSIKTILGPAAVGTILLFLFLYIPITTLMGKGEFEYGTESFWGTFQSLVKTSLYGVKYMNMYHVEVLGGLCLMMLLAGLALAVSGFLRNPMDNRKLFFLAASLLPLFAAIATMAQHYLLGSQYLVNRTALLFIPMVAIAVFLFFANWFENKPKPIWGLIPAIVSLFVVIHAARAYQLKYTSEWYYDFNTKEVITYMDEIVPDGEKIKFGVHWLFHPTAAFYLKTRNLSFTDTLIYSKELRTDTFYDYYYVPNENQNSLHPDYVLEKLIPGTGFLMKRKEPVIE